MDGAYALLCELREERALTLASLKPSALRYQAKLHKARWMSWSPFKIHRLEAEAIFAEAVAFKQSDEAAIKAAKDELEFIDQCMERLEPHRKFRDLPLAEAHEAAQADEWKLELIRRGENDLLTTGRIKTDTYATMRLHPCFLTEIQPEITRLASELKSGKQIAFRGCDLPKLLT